MHALIWILIYVAVLKLGEKSVQMGDLQPFFTYCDSVELIVALECSLVLGIHQVFTGNNDRNTIVRHSISPMIDARFIRLHPKTWGNAISMRVELYGCLKGTLSVFKDILKWGLLAELILRLRVTRVKCKSPTLVFKQEYLKRSCKGC